jgi:SPP1 family predicted phage head-tail adaptor
MRAGQLDRTITIQRVTNGTSDTGAVVETWATLVTVRAQQVQMSIDESQRQNGATTADIITFKIRYRAVTLADRIVFGGLPYNILQIRDVGPGRRRVLELRCEWIGP